MRSLSRLHNDWAFMAGESRRLREELFRKEALTYAREMMKLARGALESIVQTLRSSGYRFVDEDKVLIEPEAGIEDWLREQEVFGIHVPLSVQAWLIEVGAINLMGSHPEWPHPAYLFEATSSEGVWYTDPLVVELPREYILYQHEEWNYRRREDGEYETGPFRLEFAPDHIHKANVSGGPPYEVDAFEPSVDALVLNERNGHTFVAHVRHALEWGGFPGFRYFPEVPESARRYVSGTIVM
jgi:hypothetical protein